MESPEACSSGEASPVSPAAGAAAAERPSEAAALRALVDRVRAGEVDAAREVRRLTRASARHRRKLAAAVDPLVAMLRSAAPEAGEAALLALLNLAVRDERCVVGRAAAKRTLSSSCLLFCVILIFFLREKGRKSTRPPPISSIRPCCFRRESLY
jgi:vacuolar protein 8